MPTAQRAVQDCPPQRRIHITIVSTARLRLETGKCAARVSLDVVTRRVTSLSRNAGLLTRTHNVS